MTRSLLLLAATVVLNPLLSGNAAAQTANVDPNDEPAPPPPPAIRPTLPGRNVQSSVGEVGQRRTREVVEAEGFTSPTGRIDGRIQNRVQSRLRNRIDRNYDPQANATSPFVVAEDRARTAGQRAR